MRIPLALNSALLIFAIILVNLYSEVSFAAMPPVIKSGAFNFGAENEYFWTAKNFDQSGQSIDLVDSNSYALFSSHIFASYGLDPHWSLGAGLDLAYAKSSTFGTDRTNSRMSAANVKAQYLFGSSKFRLIPEVGAKIAFDEIDPFSDEVMTDEGVNIYSVGSWVVVPFSRLQIFAFLGYESRAQGRSALLPWTAGATFKISNLIFSAGADGFKSIADDEDINNRFARQATTNTVNGGSLRFYSVNPDLTQIFIRGGYNYSKALNIFAGATYDLAGESISQGQSVLLGFSYRFNTGAAHTSDSVGRKKKSRDDFIPSVEEDYDESLFAPEDGD